ncbi:MAG: SBBP repeat-containing protein, partial [candidate division Zixibacteria bacterium]|nr:SBBP repeat-containing protein [candidate division Zixibacteria bacterium]
MKGKTKKKGLFLLDNFADNLKEMRSFVKKISALLFFGFFAFPPSAFCQVDTAWVRYYNGPGDSTDEAHAMTVDDSGNVYVTGWSFGGTATGMDYATIKYDRNGNLLWLKRFYGSANGYDYSAGVSLDRKSNVYVAGSSQNLTTLDDYATVKYDSQGNQQRVVFYDGPINGADGANALTVDPYCNIYVTGSSDSTNVGGVCESALNFDYVTLKYDSTGNRLWAARYSNPPDYENFAYFVSVDKGGNVYVSGYSYNWCLNQLEWVTVKYDSTGTQQWVQRMDAGL